MLPRLAAAGLLIGCFAPWACADGATHIAQTISDGSTWIMRGGPITLALVGDGETRQTGRRMLDAEIGTVMATELLKHTIHQSRPNNPRATNGFPSGHASAAWALAEAAAMERPRLRPYAYTFAAAVTWSRVKVGAHTPFQAVFGAALGYALGHASGHTPGGLFHGLIVHGQAQGVARPLTEAAELPARPDVVLWEAKW